MGYIKNYLLHQYSWQAAKAHMHKANLTPFATIKLYWNSHLRAEYTVSNLLGNLVGFIPMGLLLPILFKRLDHFFAATFCVFLFSLAFETFQLFTMLGVFDVDDLILNTLGGAIGFMFYRTATRLGIFKKEVMSYEL
ncbi:VanZ family protein [Ferruginibacter sp.]